MTIQCIITGCALISPYDERWVAGDLFDGDTQWIFNANVDAKGAALWQTSEPHQERQLTLGGNYWDKRGVFVIPKHDSELNPAARDYIASALDAQLAHRKARLLSAEEAFFTSSRALDGPNSRDLFGQGFLRGWIAGRSEA